MFFSYAREKLQPVLPSRVPLSRAALTSGPDRKTRDEKKPPFGGFVLLVGLQVLADHRLDTHEGSLHRLRILHAHHLVLGIANDQGLRHHVV